jgi:hypothetical protein
MRSQIGAILVLLTALVAGSAENAAAFQTGRELANACRVLLKGLAGKGQQIRIPNTREALLCWGYMQAIQDLVVLTDEGGRPIIGSCPPEEMTTLDLLRSFLAYGRSHPDVLKGNTAAAVIAALQNAYPCNQLGIILKPGGSLKSPSTARVTFSTPTGSCLSTSCSLAASPLNSLLSANHTMPSLLELANR